MTIEYTTGERTRGAQIHGIVIELWDDNHLQARLSNGWCFHDWDNVILHEKKHITSTVDAEGER